MQTFFLLHPELIRPARLIAVALLVSCTAAILWYIYKQAEDADKRERALEAANRED